MDDNVFKNIHNYEDRICFQREGGKGFSYACFAQKIAQLTERLQSLCVPQSSRALLLLNNDFDFIWCFHGLIRNNIVPVIVDIDEGGFDEIIEDSGCSYVIANGKHSQSFGFGERLIDDAVIAKIPHASVKDEGISFIEYTSGSLGRPKGVVHTLNSFHAIARRHNRLLGWGENDVFLAALPFTHSYTLMNVVIPAVFVGATVVVPDKTFPPNILNSIEKYKVTDVFLIPALYDVIAEYLKAKSYDVSSVRFWGSASYLLPEATNKKFYQLTGKPINQFYGSTETSTIAMCINSVPYAENYVGELMPDVKYKTADNELCVRLDSMAQGYVNSPFGEYYSTGDCVRIEGNSVFFLGRKKNLIVVGGRKFYAQEVSSVLCRYEGIVSAGIEWDENKKVLSAKLFVNENSQIELSELDKYCRECLPEYKCPRIFTVSVIPKNKKPKV